MHLVQFLLPLKDNRKRAIPKTHFDRVRAEMTDRFGGVTAFIQSPAVGLWHTQGHTDRDELVLFEVMVRTLSRKFWANYRRELEQRFEQEAIVLRAFEVEVL